VLDQFVIERYRSERPIPISTESLLGAEAEQGLVFTFRTEPPES
jgi:hypothetical protein